jgi:hypothetical protein
VEYKDDMCTEGKYYELEKDDTHTIFHIKYDEDEKEIEKKEIRKGHKIV